FSRRVMARIVNPGPAALVPGESSCTVCEIGSHDRGATTGSPAQDSPEAICCCRRRAAHRGTIRDSRMVNCRMALLDDRHGRDLGSYSGPAWRNLASSRELETAPRMASSDNQRWRY